MSKNEPDRYQSYRDNGGVYVVLDAIHIYIYSFLHGGIKFFQHSKSHFKILDSGRVRNSTSHTEDPQILEATVQNLVALSIWSRYFGMYFMCNILVHVMI